MDTSDETTSSETTEGVLVHVQSEYIEDQSAPSMNRYVFAYRVTIANIGHEEPVTLRSRHWIITDQLGRREDVKGPGVVGEEPTLNQGEGFEYTSGAVLNTPRGAMEGFYFFERQDGSTLSVRIGRFVLATPFSLN